MGYPIIRLPQRLDVVSYVRDLEALLIATCADFGVAADRVDGRSGVWVDSTTDQAIPPPRDLAGRSNPAGTRWQRWGSGWPVA